MPSGPGVIPDDAISEIAAEIPPGVASFLLTSRRDAKEIAHQVRRAGVNTVQICDRIDTGSYEEIRASLPGVSLVQVVHVTGERSEEEAVALDRKVDAILLDSGNQSLPVKELGGTGRTHDWSVSRRIREALSIPVFLAGGLTPENIGSAIAEVGPFGVDVCSGVRTGERLDERKLKLFFEKVRTS